MSDDMHFLLTEILWFVLGIYDELEMHAIWIVFFFSGAVFLNLVGLKHTDLPKYQLVPLFLLDSKLFYFLYHISVYKGKALDSLGQPYSSPLSLSDLFQRPAVGGNQI